jgi:hypothetical protein
VATIKVDTLNYQPVSSDSPAYVAQFDVTGGNTYNVDITTAIKMDAQAVPARWLIIDNTQSNGNVLVSFNGNYRFNALPYARDVFPLGKGINTLTITADANVSNAVVSISSEKLAPETDNQFLIQQVVTQVTFPIQPAETFSRVQVAGDDRNSVLFETTNGSVITYSLMSAAVAGQGWMQGIFNEPAIGNVGEAVVLAPSGGELINGQPNWVITPGLGGFLMGSGIDWYFIGVPSKTLLAQGSAAAPTYSWFVDPDTGMFRVAANTLGFAVGGANIIVAGSTFITLSAPIYLPDGSAPFPAIAFSNDTDTGFYRIGVDTIGISPGGAQRVSISPASTIFGTGLTIAPSLSISGGGTFQAGTVAYSDANWGLLMRTLANPALMANFQFQHANGSPLFGFSLTDEFDFFKGRARWPSAPNPSGDPNSLDEYQEQSWTPFLAATGSAFAYGTQNGTAVKIGQVVYYAAHLVTAIGTVTSANQLLVGGWPHAPENFSAQPLVPVEWIGTPTAMISLLMRMNTAGASNGAFLGMAAAATSVGTISLSNQIITGGGVTTLRFGGTYRAAT